MKCRLQSSLPFIAAEERRLPRQARVILAASIGIGPDLMKMCEMSVQRVMQDRSIRSIYLIALQGL